MEAIGGLIVLSALYENKSLSIGGNRVYGNGNARDGLRGGCAAQEEPGGKRAEGERGKGERKN